jgi:uncharacterized membrane protein (UPF0127 family)
MKKSHIIIIAIIALLAAVFLLFPNAIHKNGESGGVGVQVSQASTVEIDGVIFTVDVVSTEAERNKGLSGRQQLAVNEGMLFVFEKSGIYPFWMKDMNFPLDIIWINEDHKIVYMKESATPESYPEIFIPDAQAQYVIEINAKIAKEKKFKIGDDVILNISNVE